MYLKIYFVLCSPAFPFTSTTKGREKWLSAGRLADLRYTSVGWRWVLRAATIQWVILLGGCTDCCKWCRDYWWRRWGTENNNWVYWTIMSSKGPRGSSGGSPASHRGTAGSNTGTLVTPINGGGIHSVDGDRSFSVIPSENLRTMNVNYIRISIWDQNLNALKNIS